MPKINIHSNHLIYGDGEVATANPKRLYVDWSRDVNNVSIVNPESSSYELAPGEVLMLFSGVRSTSIDDTTTFSITLNPAESSVYRVSYLSGTAPAFRTDRVLTLTTQTITVSINNNATATFTTSGGSLSSVVVGDLLFLPGVATGDSASPFNPVNQGFWVVVGKTGASLTCVRRVGEAFAGVAEAVALTTNAQFQAFSAAGVQVGDSLEISNGFSVVSQMTFIVSEVTASWVEFTSTEPLPLETGIEPTASGFSLYTDAKRFYRVEVDQEAVVRRNGDTGNTNRVSPRVAGDCDQMGWNEAWGPTWQLVVVNRSATATMLVNCISVE